jgi:heme-degrading monooxygenase HmoA
MTVKVFIKRKFPDDKIRETVRLIRKLRRMAMEKEGYIAGETLRDLHDSDVYVVISTWESDEDWKRWFDSPKRRKIQNEMDDLLEGETEYEIFHYGSAK